MPGRGDIAIFPDLSQAASVGSVTSHTPAAPAVDLTDVAVEIEHRPRRRRPSRSPSTRQGPSARASRTRKASLQAAAVGVSTGDDPGPRRFRRWDRLPYAGSTMEA